MANTGRIRYEEQDVNPNSPTFGQTRFSEWQNNEAACPLPKTYFSVAKSGYTTKNDCASGSVGTQVFYTVPAGYATSTASQEEADAVANTRYENTRQRYANDNGTCQLGGSDAPAPLYATNGCFQCKMRDTNGQVRDATPEEIAQYYKSTSNGVSCPACALT